MSHLTKLYVRVGMFARGQTMAEYVLVVAAVAVVVYAGYQVTGSTITSVMNSVDTAM